MDFKKLSLKCLGDAAAVILFILIAFMYFQNPVQKNMVLDGVDNNAALGSSREMRQYMQEHNGERTRWTNTIFCGMPTYQMAPSYPSTQTLSKIETVYQLGLPEIMAYVFMMLLGFYIMLRCFNFKVWMAALGAVLWAFSSYYFIIIAAGHIWKLLTLSFIPPTIGGMVLCYRGKYLWGAALTTLFTALQILSNHVQMTYYFLFLIGFMALGFLLEALRKESVGKALASWGKATLAFGVASLLGVSINVSNLFHTWEYSKETMRAKSELTSATKDEANQTKSGLERDYITAWSYGGDELMTLMIPDAKGGYSAPLSMNQIAMEQADMELAQGGIYNAFTQYHGEQPMTSGPVYVGAIVVFLFFLGLFIVKGPMTWCLLLATMLSILLSLGHNLMSLTNLFLDYVPMYDKFRTPASILVVAEFTMPLLGLMGLKKLFDNPKFLSEKSKMFGKVQCSNMVYFYLALALTAGACLLFYLSPELMGSFISSHDTQMLEMNQLPEDSELGQRILGSIAAMRMAMFQADAIRSFWFIIVGAAVVYGFTKLMSKKEEGKTEWLAATATCILLVLCLADMWNINRRYLNDNNFKYKEEVAELQPSPADQLIMQQDQGQYNRVLNTTVSTFNDNTTAYFHYSIGGYHAAKLRRYQELIEAHIAPEMGKMSQSIIGVDPANENILIAGNTDSILPVLNMLNMKWVILRDNHVLRNNPNGNAWFVNEVKYVNNADEELAALGTLNTRHQAVADKKFQAVLGEAKTDSTATARLTQYGANEMTYEIDSKQGGLLVLSDIYYPGWTATLDGKEVEIGRVNYVLRALQVEGGKHDLHLTFKPQSVSTTETIAKIALGIMFALFALAIIWPMVRSKVKGTKG